MYQKSQNVTFNKSQILFPGRWAGKCYPSNTNFTTFCYAKNMMWVDFKCHKFNNSHFILVTKVTIHYHKKKKKIQYLLISIPTIAATLKFMGRRNTAFHFTPETSGTYTFY